MTHYSVTVFRGRDERTTVMREAANQRELVSALEREFGDGARFDFSARNRELPEERVVTDWEAEGRRIALESMDLPDGAYCAMADELGLDPF